MKNNVIEEFNENGKLTYAKSSTGGEVWFEYDEDGRVVHHKDSRGEDAYYEYDKIDNTIHYKNSKEREVWMDSNGKLMQYRNNKEEEN